MAVIPLTLEVGEEPIPSIIASILHQFSFVFGQDVILNEWNTLVKNLLPFDHSHKIKPPDIGVGSSLRNSILDHVLHKSLLEMEEATHTAKGVNGN